VILRCSKEEGEKEAAGVKYKKQGWCNDVVIMIDIVIVIKLFNDYVGILTIGHL
jgi:hypothetical protein